MYPHKHYLILFIFFLLTIFVVLYIYTEYSPKTTDSFSNITSELQVSNQAQVAGITTQLDDPSPPDQSHFSVDSLYALINSHRVQNGLSPLRAQIKLEFSAKEKIEDMIAQNYFEHQDQASISSWYLFNKTGYHFQRAGENLAFGLDSPWQVFINWEKSEAHNNNLLDSTFDDMGLAVDCQTFEAAMENTCIVVLHLGKTK